MAPVETEELQVEVEAPMKVSTENMDGEEEEEAEEEAMDEAPLTPPDEPKFIDVQPLLPAP